MRRRDAKKHRQVHTQEGCACSAVGATRPDPSHSHHIPLYAQPLPQNLSLKCSLSKFGLRRSGENKNHRLAVALRFHGRPLPTKKRWRTSSKHAPLAHLLHACAPHFHIPVT